MNRQFTEAFIPAPWGKIAIIKWGDSSNEPVLMVHGRQDSAATFIPLVDRLPETFCYVAVDLPGHGRSDPFPKGITVSRYHFIHAVDLVATHFGWKSFIFVGHSMGCEMGLFYNAATPGMISKMVHLDAGPTFQRLDQSDHEGYYRNHYQKYYGSYKRYNSPNKLYTERQALDALMKARGLPEDLAKILLERNLVSAEGGKYRLSWDPRSKYPVPQNMTKDYYLHLFSTKAPPTLFIRMSDGQKGYTRGKEMADYLIDNLTKINNIRSITIHGGHDYHVTNSSDLVKHVADFLNKRFCDVQSKL